MPSGYTADIYEGKDVSLRDFLMQIGRGMGFAVMQRDDPPGEPIKKVEPSDYYDKRVAEVSDRLEWLRGLSSDQASVAAHQDFIEAHARYTERVAEAGALKARYETMLGEVYAWKAPEELEGVKKLAREQLQQPIDFDCSTTYLTEPRELDGATWLAAELTKSSQELERAKEHRAEEIERTDERNRYIDLFYASLPTEIEVAR